MNSCASLCRRHFIGWLEICATAARKKGMALFPRNIGGKYAMIARDNENCS